MCHMYYHTSFIVTGQKSRLTSHQHYQPLKQLDSEHSGMFAISTNDSVLSGVVVAVKVSESWLTSVHSTTHWTERSYLFNILLWMLCVLQSTAHAQETVLWHWKIWMRHLAMFAPAEEWRWYMRNSKVVAVRPHVSKEKEISIYPVCAKCGCLAGPMSLQIITIPCICNSQDAWNTYTRIPCSSSWGQEFTHRLHWGTKPSTDWLQLVTASVIIWKPKQAYGNVSTAWVCVFFLLSTWSFCVSPCNDPEIPLYCTHAFLDPIVGCRMKWPQEEIFLFSFLPNTLRVCLLCLVHFGEREPRTALNLCTRITGRSPNREVYRVILCRMLSIP